MRVFYSHRKDRYKEKSAESIEHNVAGENMMDACARYEQYAREWWAFLKMDLRFDYTEVRLFKDFRVIVDGVHDS